MIKYGSSTDDQATPTGRKKWRLEKANWVEYQNILNIYLQDFNITEHDNATTLVQNFTKIIIRAAEETIGYKKTSHSKSVPWWNEDCYKAISDSKVSLNRYKKHRTIDNLIELKRTKARARRIIKESKKQSWQKYVGTITKDTPVNEV